MNNLFRVKSFFERMRREYKNTVYKAETGFLLNYLTLKITDDEINARLMKHRGS